MTTQLSSDTGSVQERVISEADGDLIADAFERGRQGFMTQEENPHVEGTVLFHVWNLGHTAAELDADEVVFHCGMITRH